MTFWGKNSVIVPLDTLINKEKENTSRPVAARSCGSVGRWGKMGFTSTRTYALKVPTHVSPATSQSPDQIASPPGVTNSTMSGPGSSPPTVEPPKPKKFFKSRNTTAPLDFIRTQFMQHHMSHIAPISPGYSVNVADGSFASQSTGKDSVNSSIKIKIQKSNKKRRESKDPKEEHSTSIDGSSKDESSPTKEHHKDRRERKKSTSSIDKPIKSPKPVKKKKEEKTLKPEAPPSRVLGRSRKQVNYNEDDDSIPYRPSEVPSASAKKPNGSNNIIKIRNKDDEIDEKVSANESIEGHEPITTTATSKSEIKKKIKSAITVDANDDNLDDIDKNDDNKSIIANNSKINNVNAAIEHPPIVLRISKGTSRLVSTDSEEGKLTTPVHESSVENSTVITTNIDSEPSANTLLDISETKISSTEELLSVLSDDKPEIPIVVNNKKTRKKSINSAPTTATAALILSPKQQKCEVPAPIIYPADTIPDINYESKISPDKPPKERLKLIIKTDVLRKALAAEAEKAEKKKEKEKNKKHHKHHHHHHHHKSLTLKITNTDAQFKTPSPQPVVATDSNCDLYKQLTINSPSERDFDSQSSILGSVSSKATTAIGQFPAANIPEESCVIRSRGSSDITSDLETSQHSSLVAPPSDIESRLESMMDAEDDPTTNSKANGKKSFSIKLKLIEQEPLKEDILEVLTGGNEKENISIESDDNLIDSDKKLNVKSNIAVSKKEKSPLPATVKRTTRNRKKAQEKSAVLHCVDEIPEADVDQIPAEKPEPILETLELPTKSTGRSLRLRGNNATAPALKIVPPTIGVEEPLKSPIRRGQRNAKKHEVALSENISGSVQSIETEEISTPRNTRGSRTQKSKTNEEEVQIDSISEKKAAGKRNKKVATASHEEQQDTSLDTSKEEESEVFKKELQSTRGSRRTTKSDTLSSPSSSPVKTMSPVKNIQEETPLLTRKGRTPRKSALSSAKLKTDASELELVKDNVEKNLPLETSTIPNVRSYGSRKRKPAPADAVSSDLSSPPGINKTPASSIDLPETENTVDSVSVRATEDNLTTNMDTESPEKDASSEANSVATDASSISPTKEYKVNKFKRAWYERDSKTNLENEKPLDNIADQYDIEDGEPLIKKSTSISNAPANNAHDKPKSRSNSKIVNNNTDTSSIAGLNAADAMVEGSNNNGNLDEKQIKLVISKKKGSIFKSRALVAEQGGITSQDKKRYTYVHKWDAKEEQEALANAAKNNQATEKPQNAVAEKINTMDYDDDDEDDQPLALSSRKKPPVRQIPTSITNNKIHDNLELAAGQTKVDKNTKEYYTVIRNVKTAHQIQEIGEYQEMDDDVEYILDALQPRNPSSTRCLSALQLATKCMTPAFRMHVRAHGTVTKFFKALQDAKTDKNLGLCTAAIMFVLSQDTLNMDLDPDSLELMMNLLESDTMDSTDSAIYERNKQKVRELCEEIKSHGKGAHLNIEAISAGTLAMETLLSLTSKRAGEWFKEELRELGGLEHIIKTICDCCHQISDYVVSWTEILLEKLKTIERCLRVLENVSLLNEVNQTYILKYGNGHAVNTLFKLYKLCDSEIALYPTTDATPKDNPGVVLREALVPTLKVLINLTHPFDDKAFGSSILGQRQGIFDTSFHILLQAPNYVPERCIFDLSILVLLLLMNLTMHTLPNRQLIMQSHAPCDFGNQFDKQPAIKALIEYFYRCEEFAKQAEKNTDAILENPLEVKKSQEEFDETVTKLLQKAGHHMEHTLQASYAAILIGHLISDSKENEQVIRSYLRESSFNDIIKILEKYYNFMNLTASSEPTVVSHIKSTKKLIDYYKQCESHSSNENDQQQKNKSLDNKQIDLNETSSTIGNNDTSLSSSPSEPTPSTSVSTRNNIRVYKTYSQR